MIQRQTASFVTLSLAVIGGLFLPRSILNLGQKESPSITLDNGQVVDIQTIKSSLQQMEQQGQLLAGLDLEPMCTAVAPGSDLEALVKQNHELEEQLDVHKQHFQQLQSENALQRRTYEQILQHWQEAENATVPDDLVGRVLWISYKLNQNPELQLVMTILQLSSLCVLAAAWFSPDTKTEDALMKAIVLKKENEELRTEIDKMKRNNNKNAEHDDTNPNLSSNSLENTQEHDELMQSIQQVDQLKEMQLLQELKEEKQQIEDLQEQVKKQKKQQKQLHEQSQKEKAVLEEQIKQLSTENQKLQEASQQHQPQTTDPNEQLVNQLRTEKKLIQEEAEKEKEQLQEQIHKLQKQLTTFQNRAESMTQLEDELMVTVEQYEKRERVSQLNLSDRSDPSQHKLLSPPEKEDIQEKNNEKEGEQENKNNEKEDTNQENKNNEKQGEQENKNNEKQGEQENKNNEKEDTNQENKNNEKQGEQENKNNEKEDNNQENKNHEKEENQEKNHEKEGEQNKKAIKEYSTENENEKKITSENENFENLPPPQDTETPRFIESENASTLPQYPQGLETLVSSQKSEIIKNENKNENALSDSLPMPQDMETPRIIEGETDETLPPPVIEEFKLLDSSEETTISANPTSPRVGTSLISHTFLNASMPPINSSQPQPQQSSRQQSDPDPQTEDVD